MTIDVNTITARKEALSKDISDVKGRLIEYDKKKQDDTALLNALLGAFQQCDAFLKELDNDTPEEESDEG
jgi:hypothetical protein